MFLNHYSCYLPYKIKCTYSSKVKEGWGQHNLYIIINFINLIFFLFLRSGSLLELCRSLFIFIWFLDYFPIFVYMILCSFSPLFSILTCLITYCHILYIIYCISHAPTHQYSFYIHTCTNTLLSNVFLSLPSSKEYDCLHLIFYTLHLQGLKRSLH